MKVVAFAMRKGGVGKSTLSQAVAVAAESAGLKVALIDMDTQKSSVKWAKRRDKEQGKKSPITFFSDDEDLPEHLENAKEGGIDLVILDTQGGHNVGSLSAFMNADLVIAPITPQYQTAEQLPHVILNCKSHNVPLAGVLSMATPNAPNQLKEATDLFVARDVEPIPVSITRRIIHDRAGSQGLTASEVIPEGLVADEINQLLDWILTRLKVKTQHKPKAA